MKEFSSGSRILLCPEQTHTSPNTTFEIVCHHGLPAGHAAQEMLAEKFPPVAKARGSVTFHDPSPATTVGSVRLTGAPPPSPPSTPWSASSTVAPATADALPAQP